MFFFQGFVNNGGGLDWGEVIKLFPLRFVSNTTNKI